MAHFRVSMNGRCFCVDTRVSCKRLTNEFPGYISFPTSQLVVLPSSISLPSACPILCAGVTAYRSLRTMNPQPGKWCVVVGGAGGLGHLAIQYARSMGLRVVAIDGSAPEKRDFCFKMGAEAYVDFTQDEHMTAVRDATHGGADYILVLSPHQSSYE